VRRSEYHERETVRRAENREMSHWNYRLVKVRPRRLTENYYEIREVHYDDNGNPIVFSMTAATASGETRAEVIQSLARMISDVIWKPTVDDETLQDIKE
jgi:hypothetical protein